MKITIGLTYTEARYENYPLWLKGNDENIDIIKLSFENFNDIEKCDGLVLSGGVDMHPRFYKNERLNYPLAPSEFKDDRDELEIKFFQYAQKNNLSVLAICRGMQLVNVALGGDLIQDLQENNKEDHRRHEVDRIHEVNVLKDSLLYEITNQEKGIINSAHHQALGKIANELIVNSWSADEVVEGVEWKDKNDKSFLLCVQWHPERLAQGQPDNPFTKNIRNKFLEAVKNNNERN